MWMKGTKIGSRELLSQFCSSFRFMHDCWFASEFLFSRYCWGLEDMALEWFAGLVLYIV
jgi:hypothetical protein